MVRNQYVGRAGQLAVMGELALRGYNVAMPEIDEGDDVLVYRASTAQIWRLQVKTARPKHQVGSRRYDFRIRGKQITTPANPPVHFVFAMRTDAGWSFVVISQAVLNNYLQQDPMFATRFPDKAKGGEASIRLVLVTHTQGPRQNQTWCSRINMTSLVNNWEAWPDV
jgi:hypothetical protein